MDAKYLNDNVNTALTEALTAMAVASPADKVEYVAKYLIQYVSRVQARDKFQKDSAASEEKAKRDVIEQTSKKAAVEAIQRENDEYNALLPSFMFQFEQNNQSKQQTMDDATKFLASFLKVPASYIAIKKPAGESENLHYFSASPGQEHVVGKKIGKPVEEGDEVPERQGLSFDAFKVPEIPEEEPVEVPEGEEPPPPRPPPVPLPLVVDNCMRDKRCKFFGIPLLGAYVAVPFSFQSLDHEAGCAVAPPPEPAGDGEGAPVAVASSSPYVKNLIKSELIICIDTIGAYRRITDNDIKIIQQVGNSLLKIFTKIEDNTYGKHVSFLEVHNTLTPQVVQATTGTAEAEAAALAAVEASLAPPPASADPDAPAVEPAEPPHEAFKPYKDADAVVGVWGKIVSGPVLVPIFESLQGHLLPVVPVVQNLFYAAMVLAGGAPADLKDVCGDISWEKIRLVILISFYYFCCIILVFVCTVMQFPVFIRLLFLN